MRILKAIVKVLLGLFMVFAGLNHLTVAREEFVAQVPVWIQFSPGFTDFVVLASGVMEILLGLAMLILWKERSGWGGCCSCHFLRTHFPGQYQPVRRAHQCLWLEYRPSPPYSPVLPARPHLPGTVVKQRLGNHQSLVALVYWLI